MKNDNCKTCYATLALGYEYNQHARQLAQDINTLSPNTPFIVLTDRPRLFSKFQNAVAIRHRAESVGIFHDKLFCFKEGFKDFDCVIFLDADCRLIDDFASSRQWQPGCTAISCWKLSQHIDLGKKQSPTKQLQHNLTNLVIQKLQIDVKECLFVYECGFVLRKDGDKTSSFIKIWENIRDFFEVNGLFHGEGVAIGLAAAKSGMKVLHYKSSYKISDETLAKTYVYKDRLFYKLLIHKDKEGMDHDLCEKILAFNVAGKQISRLSVWRKTLKKLFKPIQKTVRLQKLKSRTNKWSLSEYPQENSTASWGASHVRQSDPHPPAPSPNLGEGEPDSKSLSQGGRGI